MKPPDAPAERSTDPASPKTTPRPARVDDLWEVFLSRENLARALRRVEVNRGARGPDGMSTAELRPYLKAHWPELRASLDAGTYRPSPGRRVTIPKPGGGERELGVPTVIDRFLQQALSQVLSPVFEPSFSDQSFGFRPGRSAHQAHLTVNISIAAGAATGARNVTVVNIDGGRDIENNSLTVNPAPTISSLSPSSRGQGAASQNIVITGSNFLSGSWPTSSVVFASAGITVNSVTRTNSTHLTVNVTISATATLGSSGVTVTNLDAGVGSLVSAFTVNARPTILSLSPSSYRHGLSNRTVIITGTGFVSGATVAFSGSGITVNSVAYNSATQLTVVISLSGSAATGSRNVTVTNPDAGFYTLSNGFTVLT